MLELQAVERQTGLTPESFAREYLHPMKPVVLSDLTATWPARTKWTIEYFKEKYGHLRVPVVSNNYSKPGKGYMEPDRVISFREYLEIPGETLFMPSGFWHYIEYTDGGYSISLRSFGSVPARLRGIANIAAHFVVDKGMNRLIGPSWRKMKERMAERRAGALL